MPSASRSGVSTSTPTLSFFTWLRSTVSCAPSKVPLASTRLPSAARRRRARHVGRRRGVGRLLPDLDLVLVGVAVELPDAEEDEEPGHEERQQVPVDPTPLEELHARLRSLVTSRLFGGSRASAAGQGRRFSDRYHEGEGDLAQPGGSPGVRRPGEPRAQAQRPARDPVVDPARADHRQVGAAAQPHRLRAARVGRRHRDLRRQRLVPRRAASGARCCTATGSGRSAPR